MISSSIMTDEQVKNLIRAELTQKTLGVTEQYLEIHEVVYETGELKIDRIDREDEEGLIIAYLPIKDEYFSLAVLTLISERIIVMCFVGKTICRLVSILFYWAFQFGLCNDSEFKCLYSG